MAEAGVRCRDFYNLEVCDERCLARRAFDSGRSIRMDEGWVWCYEDNAFFSGRVLENYG